MRKIYLDNIRWITVVIVVFYHVIYMYNAEGVRGVVGKITNLDKQYYDVFQYMVFPWIMLVLFMVSGVCSKLYLDAHTNKEFIKSRTVRLLVPSTIGLFAFQFLQGIVNAGLSGASGTGDIPLFILIPIFLASGTGVLWYMQLLWLLSLLLIPIRKLDKDRLWNLCARAGLPVLIALVIPMYLAAQVLNTPFIVVYRVGYYFAAFLIGYFVLSHDEVVEVLKKWFLLFLGLTLVLGAAFCWVYFLHADPPANYAEKPVNRSVLFVTFGYAACMAIFGGMAKYADKSNAFTQWMSKRSLGLYVFHYLGISSVGLYLAKPGYVSAPVAYLLSAAAGFLGAYVLFFIISRIPGYRWAVLGMKGSSTAKEKVTKNEPDPAEGEAK